MIVYWALAELGLPYEAIRVDLDAEEQKQPGFLQLNPNGQVPVLVHDGVALFESVAILIHLGETFGVEMGLFPGPGLCRAVAIRWLVWCSVALGGANSRYHHNTSERFPAAQRNALAAERATADVHALLRILDEALVGKRYLVNEQFSLADVHVSSWVSYLRRNGTQLDAYAALSAWRERCISRPAAPPLVKG
jgi:glutathione S-transferase